MKISRKIIVFLLLSLVSLFADMTYEGARSVGGAYLEYLSAPALFAGLLGTGELISYAARAITGGVITRFRNDKVIWTTVIFGYVLNLAVIPVLAFIGNWEIAFVLLLTERIGKGLRNPSRDVILSEVVEEIGRGRGFGLHEFLDQLGAISGPLIIAYFLSGRGGYSAGFKFLAIPASISIALVLASFITYPKLSSLDTIRGITIRKVGGPLKSYIFLFSMISAALIPWSIVSYNIVKLGGGGEIAALLYMIAMVTDAIGALLLGYLYDRAKLYIYLIVPPLSFISTFLFLGNGLNIIWYGIGAAIWGIVMGYFESVFRATISELSQGDYVGGFGAYAVAQALAFGIGAVFYAVLYTLHPVTAIGYSLVVNTASAVYLYMLISRGRKNRGIPIQPDS